MGEFMGEGVRVRAAFADDDMAARGVGAGPDLGGRLPRRGALMDADVAEVRAQPELHVGPGGRVHGATGRAQHVLDGRALHGRGLLGRAVALVAVLPLHLGVSGPAEHLDHGGVARPGLQRQQAGRWPHRLRGSRRRRRTGALDVGGFRL